MESIKFLALVINYFTFAFFVVTAIPLTTILGRYTGVLNGTEGC